MGVLVVRVRTGVVENVFRVVLSQLRKKIWEV